MGTVDTVLPTLLEELLENREDCKKEDCEQLFEDIHPEYYRKVKRRKEQFLQMEYVKKLGLSNTNMTIELGKISLKPLILKSDIHALDCCENYFGDNYQFLSPKEIIAGKVLEDNSVIPFKRRGRSIEDFLKNLNNALGREYRGVSQYDEATRQRIESHKGRLVITIDPEIIAHSNSRRVEERKHIIENNVILVCLIGQNDEAFWDMPLISLRSGLMTYTSDSLTSALSDYVHFKLQELLGEPLGSMTKEYSNYLRPASFDTRHWNTPISRACNNFKEWFGERGGGLDEKVFCPICGEESYLLDEYGLCKTCADSHYVCEGCGKIKDTLYGQNLCMDCFNKESQGHICYHCKEYIVKDQEVRSDGKIYCKRCELMNKCSVCHSIGEVKRRGIYRICESCRENKNIVFCDHCDKMEEEKDTVSVGGQMLCMECADTLHPPCADCGSRSPYRVLIDDTYYCENCASKTHSICEVCGDLIPIKNGELLDVCENCQ